MKRILLVFLFAATLMLAACGSPADDKILPGGTDQPVDTSEISEIPDDDALAPTEYSGIENLAFIAGVFSECDNYRAVTTGVVSADLRGNSYYQTVFGRREFSGGKLLTLSASKSAFVSVAEEKYFAGDRVLIRRQTEKSLIDGENTTFDGDPECASSDEYRASYGEVPRGASDLTINRDTVLSTGRIGRDGENYYLSASLDPVKSTAVYQKRIATLMGSADIPSFESVDITFFFDAHWKITRMRVNEVYRVEKFGMICTSDLVTYFDYGGVESGFADYYAAFENRDLDKFVRRKTRGDYIAEAFSDGLGGAFKATVSSGGESAEMLVGKRGDGTAVSFGGTGAYYKDKLYFTAGGKSYSLDALAFLSSLSSDGANFNDIAEDADFEKIFSAAADGFKITANGATASFDLVLGGVSASAAINFDTSGETARHTGFTAYLDVGGGYAFSALPYDGGLAFVAPDVDSASDITGAAISFANGMAGSVFSADFGAELKIAEKPITCEKGRFSYDKGSENFVFKANFIKDDFTYRVRYASLESAAYVIVDDDKYVLGGGDRDKIKEFFEELTGGVLGEIKDKSPLFALIDLVGKTDFAALDLKEFSNTRTVGVSPSGNNKMSSEYFGFPVSATAAELTFGGYAESISVSGVSGYEKLDDITELLSAAGKTYAAARDDKGDAAFKISGQTTLLLGMAEISLSPIPILVTAEIAARGEDVEAYIKLSYDYYFAGVGIIGAMIINGDTDTEIAIKNEELYISRHQTTYGRSSLLRYVETACDYREYRHVTVDYAKAHFSEILGFVLNVGDDVQSVLDAMGQLPAGKRKFVLGEYLKDYSYSGNKFYLTLSGDGIMGGGALGDLDAEISRRADGRLSAITISGSLEETSSVVANLQLDSLTQPFGYTQAKEDIDRVISAVSASGAALQK
ncbi:MAG: hypothetical protein J6U35_00685 [Clostridia bacterium]|nr:hypothetical protein [Clostridia bacterium]